MAAILVFMGAVVLTVLALILLRVGGFKAAYQYFFKTKKGKGAWLGISAVLLAVVAGCLIAFYSNKADANDQVDIKYLNYGYMYVGTEYPFNAGPSPQCEEDGPDNKWTSSAGLVLNGVRVTHQKVTVDLNAKYQHHSCNFNEDRFLYDAVGLEFRLYFFRKP